MGLDVCEEEGKKVGAKKSRVDKLFGFVQGKRKNSKLKVGENKDEALLGWNAWIFS